MLHINEVIIVEGRYDRERLKCVTDAVIVETNGFAVYTDKRLLGSIKGFAKTRGIIILTDSDSAGFRIRNYVANCVLSGNSGARVRHAYIPQIEGKEKRKSAPSREGALGVEGMNDELLIGILSKASENTEFIGGGKKITKQDFYEDGLTGGENSGKKRAKIIKALNLPPRLSTNAFLDIINKICTFEEYKKMVAECDIRTYNNMEQTVKN